MVCECSVYTWCKSKENVFTQVKLEMTSLEITTCVGRTSLYVIAEP